jgi:hypothetical protein
MTNVQLVDEPRNALSAFVDGYKEMNITFEPLAESQRTPF